MIFSPGQPVTINGRGDLFMVHEARPFISCSTAGGPVIERPCRVVKMTKAGLVEVELIADPRQRSSFPQRNVDPILFTTGTAP